MDHTYSRRVDTFDDVSDTEDEPFVPVQYVKPIQRSMPKQGQIPLSARHKPSTDGAKSLEKPASGDQQPEPDTRPESPEPLHPMEEFNIAEAKRKEEKARVKAAEEEAKRQAEKEKEEKLAQDEVKEVPKPEVAAPRDPGIVGPPPPDEVPDIVLVEEKEEKNIEDLPWPDCIPKIESFAHFRREKLKVELEKQEKAAAERAAKGLPPLEYKEPTWGSDWSIMPPIEWAYDEKGEKYARFKQVRPPATPLKNRVSNQYLDPYEKPSRIVKTGVPKPAPSAASIPLGQSFNSKNTESQSSKGSRPLTRPSTSDNQTGEKPSYQGPRPLTRPSASDNQTGEKSTYQGQRPLTRRSTSTQKPQEQLVSPQTNSQEMEQKKSFGKQQEQQKPLKSFGFDKPTEQKPLKSSGFGNQAEEQKEPEQEQEQPEEAPKQPAIQIPRIQQPVEIRESYQCCGCQTEVPHSQLFICLLASCPYRIKEKHALHVPSQFFGQEKVFCGYCSFMGCHSPHAKQMVEALPLAISTASAETGDYLKREFDDLAHLKHEDQVDYVIMGELNTDRLREIPVVEYLSSARSVTEWYARIKQLEDVLIIFKNARHEAFGYIADVAQKALMYYKKMQEVVLHDLHDRKPKEAQLKAIRLAEHARNLGLPEDYYTKKQRNYSGSESTRSEPAAANPRIMHYVEDQARLLECLDAEIRGNGQNTEQMEKIEKNLHESAVRMLYINMVKRLELIQGSMSPEQAMLDVSDLLIAKNLDDDVKKEAAKMFEENMGVQLNWPLKKDEEDQKDHEDQEGRSEQSTVKENVKDDKKDAEQ